jgi:outer membrane protein
MNMAKNLTLVTLAGALLLPAGGVQAKDAGDLLIRLRAVVVQPEESGSADVIGGDLNVSRSYMPEVDFSYFFTNNIALELIATVTKHDLEIKDSSVGDVDLGSTRVLPPTLLAQYHFFSQHIISPYVGVGVNYTVFFDESDGDNPLVSSVDLDGNWGYAFQAGADLQIPDSNWVFNADVKKIYVDPDVKVKLSTGDEIKGRNVDLDPWVFGVGIGYRFPVGTPW